MILTTAVYKKNPSCRQPFQGADEPTCSSAMLFWPASCWRCSAARLARASASAAVSVFSLIASISAANAPAASALAALASSNSRSCPGARSCQM